MCPETAGLFKNRWLPEGATPGQHSGPSETCPSRHLSSLGPTHSRVRFDTLGSADIRTARADHLMTEAVTVPFMPSEPRAADLAVRT